MFILLNNVWHKQYIIVLHYLSLFDKKINFLGEGADKIKTTGKTSRCAIIKFKTIITSVLVAFYDILYLIEATDAQFRMFSE